jgi:hypothetical protein
LLTTSRKRKWEHKSKDIANYIRKLGDQFRPKLRDSWVENLVAEESGQSVCRRVDVGPTKKIIVDD